MNRLKAELPAVSLMLPTPALSSPKSEANALPPPSKRAAQRAPIAAALLGLAQGLDRG